MLIDYWRFARANPRFLAFGFFLAFLSSAGQTYFIGSFGADIQADFGLDSGSWGQIYMIGTLASAFVLNWSGALLDRYDLRWFTAVVLTGLIGACLFMATVSSPVFLVLAIFLLRQFGQGLTSHIGITSMARYHDADRGKAIALAAMGYSAGEAILRLGGTITHHHAVGRDHRPWYDRQRPDLFARAFVAAKRELDPAGVLNPGVLVGPM